MRSAASGKFQSAPPVKAATVTIPYPYDLSGVSIRAAREGGDMFGTHDSNNQRSFNPRRP